MVMATLKNAHTKATIQKLTEDIQYFKKYRTLTELFNVGDSFLFWLMQNFKNINNFIQSLCKNHQIISVVCTNKEWLKIGYQKYQKKIKTTMAERIKVEFTFELNLYSKISKSVELTRRRWGLLLTLGQYLPMRIFENWFLC